MFCVVQGNTGYWLIVEKGKLFSYNMTIYKTEGGAKRGAKALYDKINKDFEKSFLINE